MNQALKKVTVLVMLVVVFGHLHGQYNKRMIILFDKDTEAPEMGKQYALTQTFGMNIHQKAAPMIASYSVVATFMGLKYNPIPSDPPSPALNHFLKTKDFFKYVTFIPADWNIYHIKNSQFFLFAPKAMTWVTAEEKITIEGVDVSLPIFKMNSLEQFSSASGSTAITDLSIWMNQKYNPVQPIEIAPLKSLFFNDTDSAKDSSLINKVAPLAQEKGAWIKEDDVTIALIRSHTKPWNLFVQGHGGYGEKIDATSSYVDSVAGMSPTVFQEFLLFLNSINTNLLALTSCYSGGKNLDYFQFKKELAQNKITPKLNYILAVLSSGDLPSSTFYQQPSSPLTVGLDIEKFFLACERVDGSGDWLVDGLRYLVRDGAMYESPENVPQVLIPNGGWIQAFNPKKHKILSPDDKTKELLAIEKKLQKTDLTHTQKDVLERRKKFLTQSVSPQVPATSRIQIIGDVLVKKYQLLDKPIEIKQKDVVLLYPQVVSVPLTISSTSQGFPMLLSMVRGNTTHVIDSLSLTPASKGILTFIRDAFFRLKNRRSQKTFFIETLSGHNDLAGRLNALDGTKFNTAEHNITLKQVFIQTSTDAAGNAQLKLLFQCKGRCWQFAFYGLEPSGDWAFECTEITDGAFISVLAHDGKILAYLRRVLDDIKNPKDKDKNPDPEYSQRQKLSSKNWMIKNKQRYDDIKALHGTGLLKRSELQEALERVGDKITNLHRNLAGLSSRIKMLREKLNPPPATPESIALAKKREKQAGQIKTMAERGRKQKECYDVLDEWVKNPQSLAGLQKQLPTFGQSFSFLLPDARANFAQVAMQKLSRDSLRIMLNELLKLLEKKSKDQPTVALAGLAKLLWAELQLKYGSFSWSSEEERVAIFAERSKQEAWEATQNVNGRINKILNFY